MRHIARYHTRRMTSEKGAPWLAAPFVCSVLRCNALERNRFPRSAEHVLTDRLDRHFRDNRNRHLVIEAMIRAEEPCPHDPRRVARFENRRGLGGKAHTLLGV